MWTVLFTAAFACGGCLPAVVDGACASDGDCPESERCTTGECSPPESGEGEGEGPRCGVTVEPLYATARIVVAGVSDVDAGCYPTVYDAAEGAPPETTIFLPAGATYPVAGPLRPGSETAVVLSEPGLTIVGERRDDVIVTGPRPLFFIGADGVALLDMTIVPDTP